MIALRRAAPICGGARIPRITRQRVDRPTALRIPLLRVAQVAFGNVPSFRGQGTSFQGPLLIERRMGFGTPGPEQAMAPGGGGGRLEVLKGEEQFPYEPGTRAVSTTIRLAHTTKHHVYLYLFQRTI
ncbi:hypothetical protein CABS01_12179 [Colletotrichum abscissum]|uniref:Uncharacterized protein n=1 Tax=Colletotrichum abscissum TaxID=1671311 RepID=A0A9P9XQP7_9PEZI|nr:uncharacterized protein CABS01_12179 [Colletotrichum abscissum]KAI3557577.1 hypothetical protein CABS02_02236 [Colletotrichum abscissum]KAK1491086.1 hypothetical protein CABS01_12179 [Colletotrichum abscissum]